MFELGNVEMYAIFQLGNRDIFHSSNTETQDIFEVGNAFHASLRKSSHRSVVKY